MAAMVPQRRIVQNYGSVFYRPRSRLLQSRTWSCKRGITCTDTMTTTMDLIETLLSVVGPNVCLMCQHSKL